MDAGQGSGLRIAVIGAGMAGLTAARLLHEAGERPVVFDKSRGLGGRLATRRAEGGLQFDHGAQYLSAKSEGFAAFLRDAVAGGAIAGWPLEDGGDRYVGTPGMSAIGKYLAQGVEVRGSTEVPAIEAGPTGWRVCAEEFDRVICTTPAPQAARLIGAVHPAQAALSGVTMVPNLTLMVAFDGLREAPFRTRRGEGDIAWLAQDSTKPGRQGATCWVAQAGLAWSEAHLECDKDEIAARMLPLVYDMLKIPAEKAIYVSAHRWRYAHATKPLGQPFLTLDNSLFLGGDWALSARAEGAWQSGRAMAEAVLSSR